MNLKQEILKASYEAKACHIGSALSCVDILTGLFEKMGKDDVFLFGKASGVATYYALLAQKGYFPKEKLSEYLHNYPLPSTEVPGVVHSFGSLGHGLPVATGMALANRNRKIFVLIGDGDVQEGTTYESALFARQHQLDNLYVIYDNNGLQALGKTEDILDLTTAIEFLQKTFPHFIEIKTIKGQGVDFIEGKVEWHYGNLSEEQLNNALCQI